MVRRMECGRCIGSPLPSSGRGAGEGLLGTTDSCGAPTPHLSPLPLAKGRGEKGHTKCAQHCFSFKEHTTDMISVAFLYLQGLIHFPDLVEPFILPLPPKLTINEH